MDVIGDGNPNDQYNQAMARQLYARYLTSSACWPSITRWATRPAHRSRRRTAPAWSAQWAVNVVDFRDRDSIMTPFEYDIAPFAPAYLKNTGLPQNSNLPCWYVDGVIDDVSNPPTGSDDKQAWRGLVWGCERPELLITETLAFHDRRTTINTGITPNTWQQQYPPEGSLFIEIYNPASASVSLQQTGDLYSAPNGGILLDKLDATTGTTPVWRLAIYTQDYTYSNDYNLSSVSPSDLYDPDNPNPGQPQHLRNTRTDGLLHGPDQQPPAGRQRRPPPLPRASPRTTPQ